MLIPYSQSFETSVIYYLQKANTIMIRCKNRKISAPLIQSKSMDKQAKIGPTDTVTKFKEIEN